ncbi:hypothetical protein GYN21_02500 [Lactococcus piscium]|uniref:Colicin E3-like ribonuclease domain-containing protein n=2 Tax=Pseudolactococcus carnosus TaxID=2749961 RepID=A0ABT0AQV7_9LACT|nr:hypothetical protein [Lactococcus carnosus]
MNFRTVVKLNGHVNQELTNLYYQLYPNANPFSRSIASDVLDFLDGAMGSWATNIGVYPTMDSLFGTDNVNYYQNIRAKTKGYTYGQYTGDAIGVISGVFEVVSGTAMLAGGKAFGLVASPFTGGGSMAFSIAVIDPIGATITAHGASTATLSVVSFANGHDWDPELSGGRIENPTKSESKIWRGFRNYKNGIKTSGSGKKQKYYKWDHTHNDIEVFDSKRNHLGSMEPTTGEMYKPAVKGRTLGD